MLGGLFGSKPVDPSTVTASATEKSHGPFTLQVLVDETVVDGKRAVKPTLFLQTSQGDVEASNVEELMTNIKLQYSKRLQEKNAANATAKNKAIAANTAAKKAKAEAEAKAAKAKADAEAKALQDKVDAEEKAKILKYLKERRITPTTAFLSKKISENDKMRYNAEIHKNQTVKPAGPKLPVSLADPVAPPQSGGRTRKNRNRKNRSRRNRY